MLCAAVLRLVFLCRLRKRLGLLGLPRRHQLLVGVLSVAFLCAMWLLGARPDVLDVSLFLFGWQRVIGLAPLRPARQRHGILRWARRLRVRKGFLGLSPILP